MFSNDLVSKTSAEKRRLLVESLTKRGINDKKVLEAINKIPREFFVSSTFVNRSYEDTALPIECEQTISQPYTVAYMTALLNIKAGDKILEIGTGSGYQATVLAYLGARVFTIERIYKLFEIAKQRFRELNLNINVSCADGTVGWREFAPYKGILVTAAAPNVPESLISQLETGGRMVIPVGDKETQMMYTIDRTSEMEYIETRLESFKFVPLIGKEGWEKNGV